MTGWNGSVLASTMSNNQADYRPGVSRFKEYMQRHDNDKDSMYLSTFLVRLNRLLLEEHQKENPDFDPGKGHSIPFSRIQVSTQICYLSSLRTPGLKGSPPTTEECVVYILRGALEARKEILQACAKS
jgi:hypothetical protein